MQTQKNTSFHKLFLSTLSLRRATNGYPHTRQRDVISIHALLAESDQTKQIYRAEISISIHALLAESDAVRVEILRMLCPFLSTLSLRRATAVTTLEGGSDNDFYPRSPCGERHRAEISENQYKHFYPRSPCGERRYFLVLQ